MTKTQLLEHRLALALENVTRAEENTDPGLVIKSVAQAEIDKRDAEIARLREDYKTLALSFITRNALIHTIANTIKCEDSESGQATPKIVDAWIKQARTIVWGKQ